MPEEDAARLQKALQRTDKDVEALTETVWQLAAENAELRRLVGLLADALTQVPTLIARHSTVGQNLDKVGDDFCAAVLEVQLWLRTRQRTQPSNPNN